MLQSCVLEIVVEAEEDCSCVLIKGSNYVNHLRSCSFYRKFVALTRSFLCTSYSMFCLGYGIRLRGKKGPAPPPLGNFAGISYLEENFKPHLLRDVCTLCSGALLYDSLLHMLL